MLANYTYLAKKRQKVLNWIYPGSHESRHVDIQSKREEGTGRWLFEEAIFQRWYSGKPNSSLLWGYGIR
jgi:hypothetical protein